MTEEEIFPYLASLFEIQLICKVFYFRNFPLPFVSVLSSRVIKIQTYFLFDIPIINETGEKRHLSKKCIPGGLN